MLSDLEERGLIEKFKRGEEILSVFLTNISLSKQKMKVSRNKAGRGILYSLF